MTGRLLNLNGIMFYSTREFKDEFDSPPPLQWVFGTGAALPGLEEGMVRFMHGPTVAHSFTYAYAFILAAISTWPKNIVRTTCTQMVCRYTYMCIHLCTHVHVHVHVHVDKNVHMRIHIYT
jgi:hypothetical protein